MTTQLLDRAGKPVRNPSAYLAAINRSQGGTRMVSAPTTTRALQGNRARKMTKAEKSLRALDRMDTKLLTEHHTKKMAAKVAPRTGTLTQAQQDTIAAFVKQQLAATADIRRTWERYSDMLHNWNTGTNAAWSDASLNLGTTSAYYHYKPLLFRFNSLFRLSNGTPDVDVVGYGQVRFLVLNEEIDSTISSSQIIALEDDHTINRRDRMIPISGYPSVYETRFSGIVLRPGEDMFVGYRYLNTHSVNEASTTQWTCAMGFSGNSRAIETGEL